MFKQNRNDSYIVNFAKNVCSGGVVGTLTLCVVYSFDYAHTRLATDVISTKNSVGERKYKGLIDVYRKTLATDGIVGLYRGFVISCVGIFIYRGCYFGLYDTLKPTLVGLNAGVLGAFLLAYGVTLTSIILTYPIDTVRRRMMVTSGEAVKYAGALDCMSQIIRKEGDIGLFRGFSVNIVRSFAGAFALLGFDKFVQLYTGIKVDTSGGG